MGGRCKGNGIEEGRPLLLVCFVFHSAVAVVIKSFLFNNLKVLF